MKFCPNCKNKTNENATFCNICGAKISNEPSNIIVKLSKISTIIYLIFYVLMMFISHALMDLGRHLDGPSGPRVIWKEIVDGCAISFIFSFVPLIVSSILSYKANKKGLFVFNLIFLIIHIFLILIA